MSRFLIFKLGIVGVSVIILINDFESIGFEFENILTNTDWKHLVCLKRREVLLIDLFYRK